MRQFRFRAAAALELRRRAEDRAREILAQATAARERAQARATESAAAVDRAGTSFIDHQRAGLERSAIDWHRSWIARLRNEADVSQRQAAVSAATAERAAASVAHAFLRRRALEKLRDRARERYQREVAREETREMNELAALRYAVHVAEARGRDTDD
jgi:flagellar export protein FliJ